MGPELLTVLISTIKSRFASIVSKLRLWTSWNFIRTRIIGGIRDFFLGMLDVRPKHKDDYYTIFGWMVSKKLAYAIIVMIGVLSIWYIGSSTKIFSSFGSSGGLRTYDYNSILLRFAKNRVRIKGKSGYIAYIGNVEKGYCTGQGELYSPENVLLYNGNFEKNKYEGSGSQYYEDGVMHYMGEFHENIYEGNGRLYREDGSLEYDGQFVSGMKEGDGRLYDSGSNEIYEGGFSSDDIVYSELLGKNATEIKEKYLGKQILYESGESLDEGTAMLLKDINVICQMVSDGGAADDSEKTEAVYVLSNKFRSGNASATNLDGLKKIFGTPEYEGNSGVIFPEVMAINTLNDGKYAFNGPVDTDSQENFSDDIFVNQYDNNYKVYVYTFRKGDLMYSFVSPDSNGYFEFYSITEAEG